MRLSFEWALCDDWFPRYAQTLICTVENLKNLLHLENQRSKQTFVLQRPPLFSKKNASGLLIGAVQPLVPKIQPNANLHSGKFEKNHYISRTNSQNQKLHFKDPHFFHKRMYLGFKSALWDYWFQRYGQILIRTVGNLKKIAIS